MNKTFGWRLAVTILAIAFCVIMLLYVPKAEAGKRSDKQMFNLNLGLDLKGGMHLTLRVVTDDAIRMLNDQAVMQLRDQLKDASIAFESVKPKEINSFEIRGTKYEDERKIRDILDDDYRDWSYTASGEIFFARFRPNVEQQLRDQAVDQALETIENRVNQFGVAEPVIQKEGGDRILVQLPGVDDPERVKELINTTAMLEFKEVVGGPYATEDAAYAENGGREKFSDELQVLPTHPVRMGEKSFYVLKAAAAVGGRDLKNARRAQDEYGAPAVGFSFGSQGAAKFEKFTAANIGKRLSIVRDKKIQSVATIQDIISSDGIIHGRFTQQAVDDMVLVLKSGALPASMQFIEERTIGPSLGADSIRKGVTSVLAGFLLVVVFMIWYYRGAGLNAVAALFLNVVITLGIMAYFRATLTLPGIAGLVLSFGMAVDANVLVFERIKEELRAGKSIKSSIDAGFKKAFVTIFDSNLTTVIAAALLFQFGSGPVKGFAVTLIIGIVASMFTAVFVSRLIFDLVYSSRKVQSLSI
jgi:preprotein translocase subunit SecD